ncbi:hypothetical protein I317_01612 [Kwoniella heveanensis CBS 569]|uniref:WSC domain-containing protein n=1 Tax=Kwoniella heveanensis BCC8398 TaxID=1296120 RepID=A0A1B9GIS4_9TREE|nr:hypothetical protein I316_07413 [Kwoniella heveanensis BCC8398]OCF44540.1 hypothetical protein I317_01612 [Kwoniella heveanensis CBS 569]
MFNKFLGLTTLLFSVTLTLGPTARAQGTTGSPLFLGCVDQQYRPTPNVEVGTFTTPEACAQACFDNANHLMYATFLVAPQDVNRCFCSNTAPANNIIQPALDSDGTCDTPDQSYVFVSSSTYDLVGCRSTESAGGMVIVASPQACLGACLYFPYAMLRATASAYECVCGQAGDVGPQAVTCGMDVWITYEHDSGAFVAGPTGFVKRQQRDQKRLEEIEKFENRFCPAGLKACKVPGDDFAFECLNVDDELESCGGCLHGEYESDLTNSVSGIE